MMVLGLVVQEPGTVADIGRRLADQFTAASFPRNSAHTNLPSLARNGHVRLAKSGPSPSLDFYEPEPAGIAYLHDWLRRSSLPAIRDVVHGKLELVELEDIPAFLRIVREDEKACRAACDLAHGRLLTHKRLLRRVPKGAADWRDRLCLIRLEDRATTWSGRAERLAVLGDNLEQMLEDTVPGEG
jgi:hypothetical protein